MSSSFFHQINRLPEDCVALIRQFRPQPEYLAEFKKKSELPLPSCKKLLDKYKMHWSASKNAKLWAKSWMAHESVSENFWNINRDVFEAFATFEAFAIFKTKEGDLTIRSIQRHLWKTKAMNCQPLYHEKIILQREWLHSENADEQWKIRYWG